MRFVRLIGAGSALVFAVTGLTAAPVVAAPASPSPPPTQAAASRNTTVASQGDARVTFADIDAFAQKIPPGKRAPFFDSPERIQSTLQNMLLARQLAQAARKNGVAGNPLVKQMVEQAIDETLANAQLQHYKESVKLPAIEQLARERYEADPTAFMTTPKVDVKHILISTDKHSDTEAAKLARKIDEELKDHPDRFDALVQKYSEDSSKAKNHGLIKDAASPSYQPAFAEAAAALTHPGEISQVIKTPYGYHILKLVSRVSGKQRSFADVHDELVAKLRTDYITDHVQDYIDTLRNKPIDADKDAVASLRTRYANEPASSASTSTAGK